MDALALVITLLAASAAGLIGAWAGRRLGLSASAAEASALTERLRSARSELAAAETRLARTEEDSIAKLERAHLESAARVQAERERGEQLLAQLNADTQRRADEFARLSAKALDENSRRFLQQAEERFRLAGTEGSAELAKREEAVKQLVEPLAASLESVRGEVTAAEKARIAAGAALTEQLEAMRAASGRLQTETRQLVDALRAPQTRGRWGEHQLRRVVEAAGMLGNVDFQEQVTFTADDGGLRPDMVVRLPGDKQIVIDAKVALSGYLEAFDATDDAHRQNRLAAHARHLRTHIDQLSAKAYWERVPGSPEFVVMFVPAEPILTAALERDPELFDRALRGNVVIATPASLIALLRTIAYTWRQAQLAESAQQVLVVGRELHKRLGHVGNNLQQLGRRLNDTVETFNRLNSGIDRNLVTQARKFSALQGLEPAFEPAEQLELMAVAAHKTDLYESGDPPQQDTGAAA